MRRNAVTLFCLFALSGCEIEKAVTPSIASSELAEPTSLEEPLHFAALDATHALFANGAQGLLLLDLHDPSEPKAQRISNYRSFSADGFYRVGDHVLVPAYSLLAYTGARDDLGLPRNTGALLNIDIHDLTQPSVVEELATDVALRNSIIRRSGDSASLVFVQDTNDEAHLVRYELRDGRLAQTADLALGGFVGSFSASADWLVVSVSMRWAPRANIIAVDLNGEGLVQLFSKPLEGAVVALSVAGNRLQVLHCPSDQDGNPAQDAAVTVDTIDLRAASPDETTGSCDIGAWPGYLHFRDASLTQAGSSSVVLNTGPQLERTTLAASGECMEHQALAPEGSHFALLAPAPGRVLALGTYQLNLYDTALGANAAPLGSMTLYTPFAGTDLTQPIQLLPLTTPSAAEDGTPEPWLVALLYNGPHPIGRFQLASMSARTLTPRGRIDDPDPPRAIGLVGQSLFTVSATTLRTFDAAALDAPKQLGQLVLKDSFVPAYHFGAYTAGFPYSEWWNAWNLDPADKLPDDLEIQSPDGKTIVATLPVERWFRADDLGSSSLDQVGDLLVRFDSQVSSWDEQRADVHLIVYDLRDPTHPRQGAHLATDAIRGTFHGSSRWPGVSYTHEVIGQAFVFTQLMSPFAFQVVDFRDPTQPNLHPRLELPGTNLQPHSTFRSGNTIYALQTLNKAVYGTAVDFTDPDAPVVGVRRAIPGYLVGETTDALYTYALRPGTTLSKITWGAEASPVLASNNLPIDRVPRQILADDRGHLFVLHGRDPYAAYSSAPHADWVGLDIFNAQTLAKLASMEIDQYTDAMRLVDGALLIPVSGATLRIDLSDEHNPRVVPVSPP